MEWTRLTFLAAILLIAPACGDDDSGDDDDDDTDGSVDDGGGGNPDGPANLIDAYQDDAGLFICPDASGQMIPCQSTAGMDNHSDGDTDTTDANCASPDDNTEFPTAVGSTGCTNGLDDDGDGAIDSADPECTGPLDEDEETFATGIPGDNMD